MLEKAEKKMGRVRGLVVEGSCHLAPLARKAGHTVSCPLAEKRHMQTWTLVATLPGAWRHRARAENGWPCVRMLWLGEIV